MNKNEKVLYKSLRINIMSRVAAVMAAVLVVTCVDTRAVMAADTEPVFSGDITEEAVLSNNSPLDAVVTEDEMGEDQICENAVLEEPASTNEIPATCMPEEETVKNAGVDTITESVSDDGIQRDGVIEHDEPNVLYVVHYTIEYNGKQLSKTTRAISRNDITTETVEGNVCYKVEPEKDFFERSLIALFKGSEKVEKGIESYTVRMKASYEDGRRIPDEDSGAFIEDREETFGRAEFEEAGAYIPESYNDVYVYANIGAYATVSDGVVISAPSGVRYCGLPHKLASDPASKRKGALKKACYDIDIRLIDYTCSNEGYELIFGKDYKVSYKNNVKASVKLKGNKDTDDYVQLYGEDKASAMWPRVVITGIGNYKGFKSTVYFDILPASLSDGYMKVGPFANIVRESYKIRKEGGVRMTLYPVRYACTYDPITDTYVVNHAKRVRYKLGRDVQADLQKYNVEDGTWERMGDLTNRLSRNKLLKNMSDGQYRVMITGKGDYYGYLYDTFTVCTYREFLFSRLKLRTSDVTYKSSPVSGNRLVRGIETEGTRIKARELSVNLVPLSDSARVSDDGRSAIAAGTYMAYVSPANPEEFAKKHPNVAVDGQTSVKVKVRPAKLKKSMFKTDWKLKGEPFDGTTKDVTISLNGIRPQDITLGTVRMVNGRKTVVALDERIYGLERGDNYIKLDGVKLGNSLPGSYKIILYGRNGYADSSYTVKYVRASAPMTAAKLSANEAVYNAGGAFTSIKVTLPDGTYREINGRGDDDFKISYKKNNKTGANTAEATVTACNNKYGYIKGSKAKVKFTIKKAVVGEVKDYKDFTVPADPGAFYVTKDITVIKGRKAGVNKLYQVSADGRRMVRVNPKSYGTEYIASPENGTYDLKLTNKGNDIDFSDGVTITDACHEYIKKAAKWSKINTLSVNEYAYVIRNTGNSRVYTSDDIEDGLPAVPVTRTEKGELQVGYVGNSYILPEIESLTVDGNLLKFSDGYYKISYSGNYRVGKAKMTVTLTQKAIKNFGIGGSKTYIFSIKPQSNTKLIL